MQISIMLTIYFFFLLGYAGFMAFAFYKVFLFAQNKDLKGYSRRISLIVLILVLAIVLITFIIIQRYQWDDNVGVLFQNVSTLGG